MTNDIGMHGQKTGKGQVYMAAYRDADGDWLDGEVNYTLHVPPNVPAAAFWSFYGLRCFDTHPYAQRHQAG